VQPRRWAVLREMSVAGLRASTRPGVRHSSIAFTYAVYAHIAKEADYRADRERTRRARELWGGCLGARDGCGVQ
jgi:hypothetical protein